MAACRTHCWAQQESNEYAKAVEALDELIWSVTPKDQPAGARINQPAGAFAGQACEGAEVAFQNETVAPFFDKLFEVHLVCSGGNTPDYAPPVEIPEASNDTSFDPFRELVKQMERKPMVRDERRKGRTTTYAKLAWVSPRGPRTCSPAARLQVASVRRRSSPNGFRTPTRRDRSNQEPIVDRAAPAGMFQTATARCETLCPFPSCELGVVIVGDFALANTGADRHLPFVARARFRRAEARTDCRADVAEVPADPVAVAVALRMTLRLRPQPVACLAWVRRGSR